MKANQLSDLLGVKWFDYQLETFEAWEQVPQHKRYCLYYRTGAGKTLTSLAMMALDGVSSVLVLAPPITHKSWHKAAASLGIEVETISHAKYRMKDYKTSRSQAVICDEFHLLGGQKGQGWQKFARMARGLQAPLIIMSATPNYNDAERCYCIQHVLNPKSVTGGYLNFLYTHCKTRHNPFGQVPIVEGFLRWNSAEEYLAALPNVGYVPDTSTVEIEEETFFIDLPDELETYGLLRARGKMIASEMELRKSSRYYKRVTEDSHVQPAVMQKLLSDLEERDKVLIYCNRAQIATILYHDLAAEGITNLALLTGKNTKKFKDQTLNDFIQGDTQVLIGTATLATGADGMDKVCDNLLIFDDTDDASLRRQVMGRILPRGSDADESMKRITRYNFP